MAVEDIDDPIQLLEVAVRHEELLWMTCDSLEKQGHVNLLPDNVFDWYESEKKYRGKMAEMAERKQQRLKRARETGLAKLSPEERQALGLEG